MRDASKLRRGIDINVDVADARQRSRTNNSTNRLLALLIEHHDYSMSIPKGHVKPAPEPVYVEPEEHSPEYKALWFGVPEPESTEIGITDIQRAVARRFDLKKSGLLHFSNSPRYAWPRQIAMYLSFELTSAKLGVLERAFGRDHSTLLYAKRKVADVIDRNETVAQLVNEIRAELVAA